jgi:hypothetical protein
LITISINLLSSRREGAGGEFISIGLKVMLDRELVELFNVEARILTRQLENIFFPPMTSDSILSDL